MSDIVERLTDRTLAVQWLNEVGPGKIMREAADEIMALRTKASNWEKVFGHLGTPDEVGNETHNMKPLYLAPRPAWRKVDDEIESGVGIRWVSDTGIHGRPTAHDVREYLERRGESAKCGCDKCTAPQPGIPAGWQSKASRDVLTERRRQVEAEGWTPEHDDAHGDGSMCMAAVCYAEWDHYERPNSDGLIPINWPWSAKWWKPRDRRRNLVKAGALILAEIERLDRRMLVTASEPSK